MGLTPIHFSKPFRPQPLPVEIQTPTFANTRNWNELENTNHKNE